MPNSRNAWLAFCNVCYRFIMNVASLISSAYIFLEVCDCLDDLIYEVILHLYEKRDQSVAWPKQANIFGGGGELL